MPMNNAVIDKNPAQLPIQPQLVVQIAAVASLVVAVGCLGAQQAQILRLERLLAPTATQQRTNHYAVISDADQLTSIPFISTNKQQAATYAAVYQPYHNYRVVKVLLME